MVSTMKRKPLMIATLLAMVLMAQAQTQPQPEELSIEGYSGQATVLRSQGRALVDVQDLARITNGSLRFQGNQIILALPEPDASKQSGDASSAGFSRGFTKAAIEAMAAIREWGGMLQVIVENGYPIGKAMAGNTIRAYQGRAADSIALASSVASTDDDHAGLELLKNEFNNAQAWSDGFIEARNSLRAANLTTSPDGIRDDEEAQRILTCGQFLAQMFASGSFQDDMSCH
jgi:hypothetical protein